MQTKKINNMIFFSNDYEMLKKEKIDLCNQMKVIPKNQRCDNYFKSLYYEYNKVNAKLDKLYNDEVYGESPISTK